MGLGFGLGLGLGFGLPLFSWSTPLLKCAMASCRCLPTRRHAVASMW